MGRREWDAIVDAFIDRMRADNLAPATMETARWLLQGRRAKAFREQHGIATPRDCTPELLNVMKRQFLEAGLTASTVHDYLRVWRHFVRFCIDRGYDVDPRTLMVKGPRQPRTIPPTFTRDEERRLIQATRCDRDRVLVQLVLETGLRRSEVARLTVDDIVETPDGVLLRVRQGKGRKDRGIPISDEFANTLDVHIRGRPVTRCRALFLTSNRRPAGTDYAPLGTVGIYMIWKRLSQATGIEAWPHKARHTAATRWAAEGLQPWAIQRALGHSTLAMTNRYVDASAVDLQAAFKRRRVGR